MPAFASALHPRAQAGRFTTTVNGTPLPAGLARLYAKFGSAKPMGFDGHAGTGYGLPNGDARVAYLQRQLNQLGFRDAQGRPLAVDGKLGPLTTQAIQAAQRRLNVKPDGKVTPQFMGQILALPHPTKTSGTGKHRAARVMSKARRRHH